MHNSFVKNLLKDGFTMMQFSVYMRHCASSESADVHEKRIQLLLPPFGKVSILRITDKQYGRYHEFLGQSRSDQKNQHQCN